MTLFLLVIIGFIFEKKKHIRHEKSRVPGVSHCLIDIHSALFAVLHMIMFLLELFLLQRIPNTVFFFRII